jgi:hypothetical protein
LLGQGWQALSNGKATSLQKKGNREEEGKITDDCTQETDQGRIRKQLKSSSQCLILSPCFHQGGDEGLPPCYTEGKSLKEPCRGTLPSAGKKGLKCIEVRVVKDAGYSREFLC